MVSSSDSDPRTTTTGEERKRRRMVSNRESARRSRARKQRRLDELIHAVAQLTTENRQIAATIDAVAGRYSAVDAENAVMRTQVAELADRLMSVNSVLRAVQEMSGVLVDIPEIPDPLLKPWQPPCPTQAILASADSLLYC